MKNEFTLAFNEVIEEKQLPKEVILEALQAAMVSAYRRAVNASNAQHVEAEVDLDTGNVLIYAEKEVVESVNDNRTEVTLKDAHQVDANAQIGSMVIVETTPENFGRVAAQTARQVIQQRIREAERDAQYRHFTRQVGEIVSSVVQAINQNGITLGLDMKAEGTMPRNHMIGGERFRVHDRVRALLLEVKESPRGPQITLSRSHRNFLRRLLENEVPEIYHGMVEIRSIAREPGQRSKVAVAALQPGVDPVGACVGIRGVRIQAIVRELNDEKIDVIEWSPDPAVYIAKALSPARVAGVYLDEHSKGAKTATVVVPEDQLSLAIGRDGQNARLAAKLTSWKIDIKSLPEAASDALHRLQTDPELAMIAAVETPFIPQIEMILAKKAEGRPVTPEEYLTLTQYVDRVERGVLRQRREEKQVEEERQQIARANIPTLAFEIPLEKFEISDRVFAVISEAGFQTVGDLMLQMSMDQDSILRLNGMGPKAMSELETALEGIREQARAAEAVTLEPVEAVEEVIGEAAPIGADVLEGVEAPVASEAEAAIVVEPLPAEQLPAEIEAVAETPILEPEALPLAQPEEQPAEVLEAVPSPAVVEEEQAEDIFAMDFASFEIEVEEEEEESEDEDDRKKKKKKKRKKFVEMEYDPDRNVMIAKKKRKHGAEWGEEW